STATGSGIVELVDLDNDGFCNTICRVIGSVKVYAYKTPFATSYVHSSLPANVIGNYTLLDHPYLNGNPNARILVTHNYNPGGQVFGVYDNKVLGVWYSTTYSKWAIFNED